MKGVLITAVGTVLLYCGFLFGVYTWKGVECREQWKLSGMETSFGFFQGCQVKTPKGWMPSHTIREVDIK